jgi:hypothetical protein
MCLASRSNRNLAAATVFDIAIGDQVCRLAANHSKKYET